MPFVIFRYEDFFSRKKDKGSKEIAKFRDSLEEDAGSDDEQDVDKVVGNQVLYSLDV